MSRKINTTAPSMATRSKRRTLANPEKGDDDMNIVVEVQTPSPLPKPVLPSAPPPTPSAPSRKRAYPRGELNSPGISPLRIVFDSAQDNHELSNVSFSDDDLVVAVSDESDTQRSVRRRIAMNQSDRFRIAQEAMDRAIFTASPNMSPVRSPYHDNKRRRSVAPVLRSPPKVVLRQAIHKIEDGLQLLKAIYGSIDAEDRDDDDSSEFDSEDIRVD